MNPPREIIALVCVAFCTLAHADEHPDSKTKTQGALLPATTADLQLLQGTWKGVEIPATGNTKEPDTRETDQQNPENLDWDLLETGVPGTSADSHPKITITITGDTFHFHRDTNFWFKTSIALPPGTHPKQLHATIRDCPASQDGSIGKVVGAIYRIVGDQLTLAAYDISEEPPKTFTNATSLYVVKKVPTLEKKAEPPKAK